jgi:hypothetical protein
MLDQAARLLQALGKVRFGVDRRKNVFQDNRKWGWAWMVEYTAIGEKK